MSIQSSTTQGAPGLPAVIKHATKKIVNPKSEASAKAANLAKNLQTAAHADAGRTNPSLLSYKKNSNEEKKAIEHKINRAAASSAFTPKAKSKPITKQDNEKTKAEFLKLRPKIDPKKTKTANQNALKSTEKKSQPKPLVQRKVIPAKKLTIDGSKILQKFVKTSSVPVDIRAAKKLKDSTSQQSQASGSDTIKDHKDSKQGIKQSTVLTPQPGAFKNNSSSSAPAPGKVLVTRPELLKQNSELCRQVGQLKVTNTNLSKKLKTTQAELAKLIRTIQCSETHPGPNASDQGDGDTLILSKSALNKTLQSTEQ